MSLCQSSRLSAPLARCGGRDAPAAAPVPAQVSAHGARIQAVRLPLTRKRRALVGALRAIQSDAAASAPVAENDPYQALMEEMMQRLSDDLNSLFSDKGIDTSNYDKDVKFEDPITKYSSAMGYAFNIQMLRRLFTPTLNVLSIRRSGALEITTRWTMKMELAALSPLRALYYPTITFTGVSILEVNPQTRRFRSHVDKWDSIKNNEYFSFEGVADLLKQMFQFDRVPDLETPEYTLLTRRADYEVREYQPFLVAEADSGRGAGPASGRGFNELAGYIFGGNEAGERMEMTTPVITRVRPEGGVAMQFPLERKYGGDPGTLPAASGPLAVRTAAEPGRVVAVAKFTGVASDADAARAEAALRAALRRDGLRGAPGFSLARYNDPSTPGPLRRNEVQIELEGFTLD